MFIEDSAKKFCLTEFSNSGGCAAKVDPEILSKILSGINFYRDKNTLVGLENNSDCGIYKINEEFSIVQTIDFFPPMVDDPGDFGEIAVANVLSDIYASGAKPFAAVNILCFPETKVSTTIIRQILEGANRKLQEAQTVLLGGHTINDVGIKFGMAAMGLIPNIQIITNSGAKVGDKLIITKRIGVGLINTALKDRIELEDNTKSAAVASMTQLNRIASQLMISHKVSACTDISGFGLIGHAHEIASASNVTLKIKASDIPLFVGMTNEISAKINCGGTMRNHSYYKRFTNSFGSNHQLWKSLYDPQTSGGLLMSVDPAHSGLLLEKLIQSGYEFSAIIGDVILKEEESIVIC